MRYAVYRRPTLQEDEGRSFLIGHRETLQDALQLKQEQMEGSSWAESYFKESDYEVVFEVVVG